MNNQLPTETDFAKLPSRRELNSRLDRLDISADAKVLMGNLLDTTIEVAGRVVEVGRQILNFVLDLFKRFPATSLGAMVGLTVTMLVSSIPILGVILGPLVGPLLAAFMITTGALADIRNSTVDKQIELFGARLDAAMARA